MSPALKPAPRWTEEELVAAQQRAIENFRRSRIDEPLERYLAQLEHFERTTERLLDLTADLTDLTNRAFEVLVDKDLLMVYRYLPGPPMSEDDLKALAGVSSFSQTRLRQNPESIDAVRAVINVAIDPRRFPWVGENRAPTADERYIGIRTTATLIAAQREAMARRTESKTLQEGKVRTALLSIGLVEVPPRNARVLADAPKPGEFCREALLSTRKADFLVGLHDRRVMPIECKVSNSFTNSIKRLNNDAAAKGEVWRRDLGDKQVVPAAVLSGLFKLGNLLEAQDRGLAIFWAHDLAALTNWIGTRG